MYMCVCVCVFERKGGGISGVKVVSGTCDVKWSEGVR